MSAPAAELALTGQVVDQADLLDAETEAALSQKIVEAERKYGPQMVVVTVKSLGTKPIEEFTRDLGNSWGIGDKNRDDGLLLLVAPNERRVRIEVGYGLEGSFSDTFCQTVIDEILLPQFQNQNFQAGIAAGVDQLIGKMKAVPTLPANDNDSAQSSKDAA